MEKKFLLCEGINKSFGSIQVVKDLSFSVGRGEIFSLLGPSGCGKTTLLRMLAGFESPDSGRILLDGKDITRIPPHKRPVNTVFQNYALFPHMSVFENVAFGLKASGRKLSRQTLKKEVFEALELIQMKDCADKRPEKLSGGQKQRVAIARAIVNKPALLLLDEPLAALDLKLRQKMLLELDRIHHEVGITFIFVTHDQGEAMSLSDRIAIMNLGEIEQIGSPAEVYESPLSSFTAAFIGDTNFFEGIIRWVSPQNDYSRLEIPGLASVVCYNDQPRKTGDHIHLSLRPEKVRISLEKPKEQEGVNVFEGIVENKVYLGAYTKYWVRCGEDRQITVMDAHRHFLLDQRPPEAEEKVWLSWLRDDGFMLESYREKDEALLSKPDEEFQDLKPDTQPGLLLEEEVKT